MKISAQEKTSDKLKYLLRAKNITNASLAREIQRPESYLYKVLCGEQDIKLEEFKTMIDFMELTGNEIKFMLGIADLEVDSEELKLLFNQVILKTRRIYKP